MHHLQVTGIGRTVNALRKIEEGVGEAAKELVNNWKTMVANTDTSEDEDEACVPDVPECYESPECDSEPEENSARNTISNINSPPDALRMAPPLSSPIVFDEENASASPDGTVSNIKMIVSEDEDNVHDDDTDEHHKKEKSTR